MDRYDMNGIPVSAAINAAFARTDGDSAENGSTDRVIRLKINAALKDIDGRYIAELAQQGFSEIAVTSGGCVYEY